MKILIEHNCEIKTTFDRWTVPSEWSSVAFSMVDEAVLFFVCPLCKHETKPQLPKKIYSHPDNYIFGRPSSTLLCKLMEDLKAIISRRRSRRLCCKESNPRSVDLETMLYWSEANSRPMRVVRDVLDPRAYLLPWAGAQLQCYTALLVVPAALFDIWRMSTWPRESTRIKQPS